MARITVIQTEQKAIDAMNGAWSALHSLATCNSEKWYFSGNPAYRAMHSAVETIIAEMVEDLEMAVTVLNHCANNGENPQYQIEKVIGRYHTYDEGMRFRFEIVESE